MVVIFCNYCYGDNDNHCVIAPVIIEIRAPVIIEIRAP